MQPAREGPNQEAHVKQVFLDAAEMKAPEREEYLAHACGEDLKLRRAVNRLLDAFDDTGGLLAGAVPGAFLLDRGTRHTFAPGDRVGRFTIVRLLGIGGMGEVYEVSDSQFGGQFALKTLRREYAERADLAARFKREIQLARRVTHLNVCRIYDVGFHETETGTSCYLTMELLSGETLSDRLRGGRLEFTAALALCKQVVSGISALHAAGVVHRDIKPANVIIVPSADGDRAVITDFGVAHPLSDLAEDDLTLSGQVIGTVKYMAPEQLTGRKVGPEADVYSLGVVMYEVIRGYQAGATGSWHQRVTRDLQGTPSAGKVNDNDRRLLEIILRCLEPQPKIRFTNAGEILVWLDRLETQPRRAWIYRRRRAWIPAKAVRAFPGVRQLGIPLGTALILGAAASLWPVVKGPALQRACRVFPGNALACELPAERDIAVLPFRAIAGNEEDAALANGYAQFIRGALIRLYPEPGRQCLHLRNDRLSDGVRLVLEAEIRPHGGQIEFAFTVRDTWADRNSSALLRSERVSLPASSAYRLYTEPLQLLSSALKYKSDTAAWQAWSRRYPQDASAFTAYLRALGHLQAGRYRRAIDVVAETVNPAGEFAYAPAHSLLAEAYRISSAGAGNGVLVARARQAAERASALDPDFDFGLAERELGDIEAGLGRPGEAIRHYSAALRSWPFDEASVKSLAAALEAEGRDREAEKTLQAAVERAPRCWLTRNALGDFYSRHSRYADAERTLLEAIRYTPRNAVMYHNLAFDYLKRGRLDDAVQMASKAIELSPVALMYSTLGRAYLYRNCADAALLNLRHAVSLDPAYYILSANLAEALTRGERNAPESQQVFARVVELSTQLLRKTPTHVRGRLQLALNLARLGKRDQAQSELERLLQASRNEETLLAAAQIYEITGRRREAFAMLERALDAGLSVFQANIAADLQLLRADSKFAALLRKHGLDAANDAGDIRSAGARSCPDTTVPGKGF